MRPNPDFRDAERAVHQVRAELGLEPERLRPERPTLTDRLSEPPRPGLGIGRGDDLFIDR
jgi:hypothetical protein